MLQCWVIRDLSVSNSDVFVKDDKTVVWGRSETPGIALKEQSSGPRFVSLTSSVVPHKTPNHVGT